MPPLRLACQSSAPSVCGRKDSTPFLPSPHGHARIARIDTSRVAALAGVVNIFTFAAVARLMKPLPLFGAPPPGLAPRVQLRSGAAAGRGGRRRRNRIRGDEMPYDMK